VTRLVQVRHQHATVERVPRGEKPVYEFHLDDHEQIVGTFHEWTHDVARRETVDHHLIVYVASDLGGSE
jgi:hypothetical protein